ncbi:mitochondrial fission ELM1 family protein [Asticcacaulis sp. 201]|uniref:mitochondrial fission ELM1 family protein n=1 Tax=Asticcacaulis sp. 201 TaxID=3028787 RepID=UPI002916E34D|nr:mitochondrial fission ELM1 family protein [Asticcacaulis sp. 201]MDV6332467.1 mitochondrial fission ELM1 family protein [Asticcacaulis sp. 201]
MPEPLTIWVVSDGRAGIENQALGLAEAVSRITPAQIVIKRIHYAPLFDRLPTALKLFPDAMLRPDSDPLTGPYPDIWIAAGRATLPHSLRVKARSGGRTFVVQLQNPKHNPKAFDLVIAPEHDHISGGNVLSLIGSTNRITAQTLADAYTRWEDSLNALPHPRVAVLIGGRSKAYDIDEARASVLGAEIHSAIAHAGGSVLLTVSRRTPDTARRILTDALADLPGLIFDGQGDNPYFAFLYAADRFLITEDSVNMATEAAATGKPIQILSMERRTLGSGEKFEDFHETLRAKGITHPFNGALAGEAYPPLDETARAARHLLDAYNKK